MTVAEESAETLDRLENTEFKVDNEFLSQLLEDIHGNYDTVIKQLG